MYLSAKKTHPLFLVFCGHASQTGRSQLEPGMRRIAVSARNSFAKFQLRMFEAPQPPFYNSLIKAQGNKCGILDRLESVLRVTCVRA